MNSHSLTARLSLMFMLAVGSVLLLAGLAFNLASHHHFIQLDQDDLQQKHHAVVTLLRNLRADTPLSVLQEELSLLLGEHGDIQARLWQGPTLIWSSSHMPEIGHTLPATDQLWDWQQGDEQYRGLVSQIISPGFSAPWQLQLLKNVTVHEHFFQQFRTGLWLGLLGCLLLSGLLGWWVVRRGLRPLRELTAVAEAVSASRLNQALNEKAMPEELRPLAAAFNAMLARLDEDFARLSSFSAEIAHELRTPVTAMQTRTEVILARPRSADDYAEALYASLEGLEQIRRLIDDMLFLARADNQLQAFAREPVALHTLARQLLDYYDIVADEQHIRLQLEGQATLLGDAPMLRRALGNLISNALRYTPAGGCITLSLKQQPQRVTVRVSNEGEPIAADLLPRLFQRFVRGQPGTDTSDHHHAGLGLAITRAIVEAQGGQISCQSDRQGTHFILCFPDSGAGG